MSQTNQELARRWFEEVWNQRRDQTVYEMLDPECKGDSEGIPINGPEGFLAMRNSLLEIMPDMKVTVKAVLGEKDEVAVHWRFQSAAQTKSGAPARAGEIDFSGISWLKFKEGRIIEGCDRWNRHAFLQQIQAS